MNSAPGASRRDCLNRRRLVVPLSTTSVSVETMTRAESSRTWCSVSMCAMSPYTQATFAQSRLTRGVRRWQRS
jgi:hypothetical protein